MYCRNCGSGMNNQAAVCVQCGVPTGRGNGYCPNCGESTNPMAQICVKCGINLGTVVGGGGPVVGGPKSKMTAGLLGIFLGSFGVHRFYLGYTGIGLTQCLISSISFLLGFLTCGITWIFWSGIGIWGLIEGIMILTGSINKDSNGMPLRD